ncbi:MAG: aldehyde dehydrogenase [Alistipes sp.]|nr:aldehyde dehydrogenase [Alistipes sp.]
MENTSIERIKEIRERQERFFRSGATLDVKWRLERLRAFEAAVRKWEKPLCEALWTDLHKSYEEAYLTEVSILLGEIRSHIHNIRKWSRPQRKATPLKMFPSRSMIISEPLGTALIISPWNYPVQLLLTPLVGAISSGCTAVLKPSPYVPNVSKVTQRMIEDTFSDEYVAVVQGNREVNSALLEERWDLIFFTGSPALGRLVMGAAAKNLTPVVLELGGKSPCIVDKDADIKVAAKRIAWGKSLNAGQTCIAPDYLMIHEEIKDEFLKELETSFKELLGADASTTGHFVRIVNDKAFDRLEGYLKDGRITFGGHTDRDDRYFEPTVLDGVSPDAPVMREEIFGPIFPVQTFKDIDEVISFVTSREKPLALYYFGSRGDYVLRHTSSGGACINDTIMHIANENIPFGGVGNSGLGSYHFKRSFDAFTHYRAVVITPTWLDLPFRYMPYKFFKAVKRLL